MFSSSRAFYFFLLSLVLFAANLRGPLVVVGPLMEDIRQTLQVSGTLLGAIGTLPVAMFAICSPLIAYIVPKIGIGRILIIGLFFIIIGMLVRSALPNIYVLLMGTALLSIGATVGNVLLPTVIKQSFPNRVGVVMGIFTTTISFTSMLSFAMASHLASWITWPVALNMWLITAILGLFCWIRLKNQLTEPKRSSVEPYSNVNFWRSPQAWIIGAFFGIQSLGFYVMINFLPLVLAEKGISASNAGYYGALFQIIALVATLPISHWFNKTLHKQKLATCIAICFMVGFAGLWLGDASLVGVWVSLMGIGSTLFVMSLALFSLRTQNTHQATQLSGMAQSIGYCISMCGPIGVGVLFDFLGSWEMAMGIITFLMLLECLLTWFAFRLSMLK